MTRIACPRCRGTLNKTANGALRCDPCGVEYPIIGGMPWLWPEPGAALLDWRNRMNRMFGELDAQIARAEAAQPKLPEAQSRIEHLSRHLANYRDELHALLAPLRIGPASAREVHLALRTRLPDHHALDAYPTNIFRDWAWGHEENDAVADYLIDALGTPAFENVLILGSGAGRLAYDLHARLEIESTIALDSNPLLCLVANAMAGGKDVSLTEFPRTPVEVEDSAVGHVLKSPGVAEGLTVVCGDALNLPVAAGAFDLIVTPWLIDVIDAPLSTQIERIQGALKAGGVWLNHGSLAFRSTDPVARVTATEVRAISEEAGFEVLLGENKELPYLISSRDRGRRHELTYTQLARLREARTTAPVLHEHTAPWLSDTGSPVALSEEFQTQIATTRIHAFIMSLIDGQRSIKDMAQVLEQQNLMPAREAVQAITQFLAVMEREAQAQRRG